RNQDKMAGTRHRYKQQVVELCGIIAVSFILPGHTSTIFEKGVCSLPNIVHGVIYPLQESYEAGSVVKVVCPRGYQLKGDFEMLCMDEGVWTSDSEVKPTCEVVLCEPPPSIPHGSVRVLEREIRLLDVPHRHMELERPRSEMGLKVRGVYSEGSVAQYSCDPGFWLHPATDPVPRLTCHAGGWLGETPHCVSSGCVLPEPPVNGYYLEVEEAGDPQYPVGARLQFVCHSGYKIRGPDVFTCRRAGEWSPAPQRSTCLPSQQLLMSQLCNSPPQVSHTVQKLQRGLVTTEGAVQGTVLEYRCKPGYRNILAPCVAHTLTCHKGAWHGTSPECQEFSSCIAPPNIAHGYMYEVASSYPLQSQVYYSCEQGYRLVGPSVLTCEDTGCWMPRMPPICQLSQHFQDELRAETSVLDMHTILVATTGSVIGILLIVLALILYQRTVGPKLMRLRNSGSGGELPGSAAPHGCGAASGTTQNPGDHDPDRVALIAFSDEGVPPTYEEAVRHRPAVMFENPGSGGSGSRLHRSRAHRGVVGGPRRTRHRDNPDNISYQSIGSTRQSSSTSRSMSMRSWSACDSLGSTDTVAVSDSTNVTVDTQSSGAASQSSHAPSCRALAGSLASFDTSSLVNNEGAPLLEEAECEDLCDPRADDQFSLSTRDSDSLKDNTSHTTQ
ncbi:unnamed protein product, partial [Meganyctiphanes norvegica]